MLRQQIFFSSYLHVLKFFVSKSTIITFVYNNFVTWSMKKKKKKDGNTNNNKVENITKIVSSELTSKLSLK